MSDTHAEIAAQALELSSIFAWQQEHSSRANVQFCGRVPLSANVHLFVMENTNGSKEAKRVAVTGVRRCNSANVCAACSTRIGRKRRAVLEEIFSKALADGWESSMLTFTVRHDATSDLVDLLSVMSDAYKLMHNSQTFNELRKHYGAQFLRVTEVTDGANGWHPHFHVAIIHRPGLDMEAEAANLMTLWADNIERRGLARPDDTPTGTPCRHAECGYKRGEGTVRHQNRALHLRARCGADDLALYVTKACGALGASAVSLEMAGGRWKSGRGLNISVWQMLALAADGDPIAAYRWAEYEKAVKRARFWSPSKGFASQFGCAWQPEDDDQLGDVDSIITDEATGALSVRSSDNQQSCTWIGTLSAEAWKGVRRTPGGLAELLQVAPLGHEAVQAWLRKRHIFGTVIAPTRFLQWEVDALGALVHVSHHRDGKTFVLYPDECPDGFVPEWFQLANAQANARAHLLRMAA